MARDPTHDEMSQTLSKVFSKTEPERCDPPKDHLRPSDDGERLAYETMREDDGSSGLCPFEHMRLEEDTTPCLDHQVPEQIYTSTWSN